MLEPESDCQRCPRLAAFRTENRAAYPDFFNAPVPSFGPLSARLLIVGLAPGLKGANRTARPFTGDYAGDLLYPTLLKFGFARGAYGASPDDGLELIDCRITNAVRCVPPQNKPVGAEVNACRDFLAAELSRPDGPEVVLALGSIAHNATLRTLALRVATFAFGHGERHDLTTGNPPGPRPRLLVDSYHCSRYNTNTGRLTTAMFEDVFAGLRQTLDGA